MADQLLEVWVSAVETLFEVDLVPAPWRRKSTSLATFPYNWDIAVVVPKRDELRGLALAFGAEFRTADYELPVSKKPIYYWQLGDLHLCIVCLEEQGPEIAVSITAEILRALNPPPPLLFLLGTAAGKKGRAPRGSVLVAEYIHDLGQTFVSAAGESFRRDAHEPPTLLRREIGNFILDLPREEYWDALATAPLDLFRSGRRPVVDFADDPPVIALEHIAGGASLRMSVGDWDLKVWNHDDRIRAYDMESGGFGLEAKKYDGLMWSVIRGVSDNGVSLSTKDDDRLLASFSAGWFLKRFIESGLKNCHPRTLRVPESSAQELSEGQFYTRFDSFTFFRGVIQQDLGLDLTGLDLDRSLTLRDFVELCVAEGVDREDAERALWKAREDYFSTKYGGYDYSNDIRGLIPGWAGEFHDVIRHLAIELEAARILDVGVGNGCELDDLFPGRTKPPGCLLGADVSASMLREAQERRPELQVAHAPAEDRGMLVPGSERLVDRAEPRTQAMELVSRLEAFGFEFVGYSFRKTDIYIWARRPYVKLSDGRNGET